MQPEFITQEKEEVMERIKRQRQKMKKKGKRKKEGAEKIVFQVADESRRAEDDADEREIEPEKAKIVEAQRELDSVERGIEGRRQINQMIDEFWKRNAAEDENDEFRKSTAREEELKDLEQGRQRELDKDENNNNKQEELPEKQKWAVNEVKQIEMIELERERGGRWSKIEDTQETPGDKVMTTSAEKEEKEEEDKLLKERKKESTLRLSLFPNMPLFLNFVTANSLPGIRMRNQSEGLKNMGWNMVAPRGKIPASDINKKEGWAIQGEMSSLYITFFNSRHQIVQGTMASTYPG